MKFYSFQIVLKKGLEDEGCFAYTPNVPGRFSNGKTIAEAKRNIRLAIEQHLASRLAHAQPIPPDDRLGSASRISFGSGKRPLFRS